MINDILERFSKQVVLDEDMEYVLGLSEGEQLDKLMDKASENNNNLDSEIFLEQDIHYPPVLLTFIGMSACNCRSLYTTEQYHPKYTENLINIKLRNIDQCGISAINCYTLTEFSSNELFKLVQLLNSHEVKVNIKVPYKHYADIDDLDIDALIIDLYDLRKLDLSDNNPKSVNMYEKFIKELSDNSSNIDLVGELLINSGESPVDIAVLIRKIIDFNINTVEVLGVDPFCDNPEEYHPQYNNNYLLKIVAILRTILPDINIKYKYPTNGISIINELLKLGVNIISGVYTDNTNPNIYNIEEIQDILNDFRKN
ncbi:MAG: hypothetical protein E7Z84_01560 [Methanosphaera stadtmanae]|nr:hypothetical protein [Methanosphaera stadtmanae]